MVKELILQLHQIGAIQFGNFEIKRGFFAPFQFDLTRVISHPTIAKGIAAALWEKGAHLSFDLMCGCPFVGSCLATYLAWQQDCPLVVCREGAPQMTHRIEGSFRSGQKCLVLRDLLLFGPELLDTVDHLEDEGLKVCDSLCFLDLRLGGKAKVKGRGITSHATLSIEEVLEILLEEGKIKGDAYKLSCDFLEQIHGK